MGSPSRFLYKPVKLFIIFKVSSFDLSKDVKNSGLFAPLLDLSCSEAGVFGTIDSEAEFLVLQFDTSANQLSIKERFTVKKPKPEVTSGSGPDKRLIIGNNFYLLRNGNFIHAINMVSQATFPVENFIEIPLVSKSLQGFISYNPGDLSIQVEGADFVRKIRLEFSKNPMVSTEISTTTTTTTTEKSISTTELPTTDGKRIAFESEIYTTTDFNMLNQSKIDQSFKLCGKI